MPEEPNAAELATITNNPDRLAEIRTRLSEGTTLGTQHVAKDMAAALWGHRDGPQMRLGHGKRIIAVILAQRKSHCKTIVKGNGGTGRLSLSADY